MSSRCCFPPSLRLLCAASFGAGLSLMAAGAAHAQAVTTDSVTELPFLIISATGTPTPRTEVASSVTVITADDIARTQQRSVPDALQAVPGLNVVQTGGPGGTTSVFMRGTNSNQVKILVDGVDMSNPSGANGAFNIGQLMTNDISRIEVLRGPQSGLYGSDAIGGVISITSQRGEGPAKITGFVEGGALGTFNQAIGVSGGTDKAGYALNVGHFASTSIPVTPSDIVPPGYPRNSNATDNWTYSGRLDFTLSDALSVNLTGRYINSQLSYTPDVFSMETFTTLPATQTSLSFARIFVGKAEGIWTALDGKLVSSFGITGTDQAYPVTGPNETQNANYNGHQETYYWRSNWAFAPGQMLTAGVERKNASMSTSTYWSPEGMSASNGDTGAYAQLQTSLLDRFFLALNARYDNFDNYGDHTTYRIAPSYLIQETGTRLKGSYGTGFAAPSLFQLYAPNSGNPNLLPEESTGWDIGFEQALFHDKMSFGATYFHNDITNLIGWDPITSTLANMSEATTQGVEAFVAVQLTDRIGLRADYTYTEAVGYFNPEQGFAAACAPVSATSCDLLRRPANKVSVSANWQATDQLNVNAELIYVSSWWDVGRLTFASVDQPGYTIVNVAANYVVSPNATIYGRINNLFDQTYQDPNGFLAPGLGAYGGVRFTF